MGETPAFDTHQRLDLLARFLRDLLPSVPHAREGRPRVLDVGGYPGLLAQSLAATHDVVTADREKGGLDNYVRASGDALPFAPGRFDAVVASDVLEHVASEARDRFLGEMATATRGWVLVGGPFRSPAVDAAEESVADLARSAAGQENAWIEEHRRCGLPGLADTRARLESLGFFTAVSPNGSLFNWFMLQSLKVILHAAPDGFGAFPALNDLYLALCGQTDHAPPTYRHLLLAHREREKVTSLAKSAAGWHGHPAHDSGDWKAEPPRINVSLFGPGEIAPQDTPEDADRIRRAADAFRRLAASVRGETVGDPVARIEKDYVARLETLLERQEARQARLDREMEGLKSRLTALESSRVVRLWKRLRGL